MATTNLFGDPAFKDGAFTSNNAQVRAYAVQKTMRSMALGHEFGAKLYVFWGGREGAETDAVRDPTDAMKRFREAMNFLAEHSESQGYGYRFAFEAKPNEPRGHIYFAVTGSYLGFIPTLDKPHLFGVNPEVAHEHMAGLNFVHQVAAAMEARKLFHIDLNDQEFGRYDQDFRFGSRPTPSTRSSWSSCWTTTGTPGAGTSTATPTGRAITPTCCSSPGGPCGRTSCWPRR